MDKKFVMISSASKALDYLENNPEKTKEEAIKHFINNLNEKPEFKILAIASANKIIQLKSKNPGSTQKQIMQMFMSELNNIEKQLG